MPFPSHPNPLDMEGRASPLTTVLEMFDRSCHRSLHGSLLQIHQHFSVLILCFGEASPDCVTCNHPLFHWVERGQTPEGFHAGQSSLHRIGKVGKPLQNNRVRVLITVVAYWLQITCFWWHYLPILYPNYSIFREQLAHCFQIVRSWQITVDCHWLHCILFIFSIISSPSLWFWHFKEDIPAEKMPDPNHRRHSWNQ